MPSYKQLRMDRKHFAINGKSVLQITSKQRHCRSRQLECISLGPDVFDALLHQMGNLEIRHGFMATQESGTDDSIWSYLLERTKTKSIPFRTCFVESSIGFL